MTYRRLPDMSIGSLILLATIRKNAPLILNVKHIFFVQILEILFPYFEVFYLHGATGSFFFWLIKGVRESRNLVVGT
jgi:hypothetical protein